MRGKFPRSFLVKSPVAMVDRLLFTTGSLIPQSGVYQVNHKRHRLPHEVILLAGEQFPRCAQCHDQVTFKLVYPAQENADRGRHVVLHELPVIEDSDEQRLAAI